MISDILDMSRLNLGKLPLHVEAVELRAIIDATVQAMHGTFSDRQQRLTLDVEPDRLPLQAFLDAPPQGALSPADRRRALGQTLARLMGIAEGSCPVRKGAAWWLRARERQGQLQAVVVTVQSPDLVGH
mgnify:CR=1 FL=1